MHTPKETNDEIKTKGYTFSPVLDVDAEECCFSFNVKSKVPLQRRVKNPFQQFLFFSNSMKTSFETNKL